MLWPLFCGNVPIQIMPIKIIVLTEYNPSGSRPNFFGRQHLTFDKGGKGVGNFRGIVRKRRSQRGGVGAVKALLLYCRTPF